MQSTSENAAIKVDAGRHYRYEYTVMLKDEDIKRGYITIKLDPFRISSIYGIADFALNTILKKVLVLGDRGHKDGEQDLKDIICAAERRLEMLKEDKENFR